MIQFSSKPPARIPLSVVPFCCLLSYWCSALTTLVLYTTSTVLKKTSVNTSFPNCMKTYVSPPSPSLLDCVQPTSVTCTSVCEACVPRLQITRQKTLNVAILLHHWSRWVLAILYYMVREQSQFLTLYTCV